LKKKPLVATMLSIGFVFSFFLTGCAGNATNENASDHRDTLYQVSTLNALMLGYYDGIISVGDFLSEGDTGLGTFDALDGEMIVLDGMVYQAKADGTVSKQSNEITLPFGAITYFDNDLAVSNMPPVPDLETLKALLEQEVLKATGNPNIFYMAKITGDFNSVHVRSVPAQEKPYKQLKEIAASQPEFEYENISGTIVAVRCPDYVEGINLAGWHLHFISTDTTKGGHLLDADLESGECQIDFTHEFKLFLPESIDFGALSLANDLQKDTQAVEGK